MSSVLFGLLLVAFVFVGMVIVAYAGPTGWIIISFISAFGCLGFAAIVWQSPIGSRPPDDSNLRDSWRESESDLDSLEKERRDPRRPRYTGDGYEYEDGRAYEDRRGYGHVSKESEETRVEERYLEDGLSRRGTLMRPQSVAVPEYTSDLRMIRQLKTSGEYTKYDLRG